MTGHEYEESAFETHMAEQHEIESQRGFGLGPTLAVFHDGAVYCDTKWMHDCHVFVTDGTRFHAEVEGIDIEAASREGTKISFLCPHSEHGEPCHGRFEFDISSREWTTSRIYVDLLERFGREVER